MDILNKLYKMDESGINETLRMFGAELSEDEVTGIKATGEKELWRIRNHHFTSEQFAISGENCRLEFSIAFDRKLKPFIKSIVAFSGFSPKRCKAYELTKNDYSVPGMSFSAANRLMPSISVTSYLGEKFNVVFSTETGINVYRESDDKKNVPLQAISDEGLVAKYILELESKLPGITDYVKRELPALKTIIDSIYVQEEFLVPNAKSKEIGSKAQPKEAIENLVKVYEMNSGNFDSVLRPFGLMLDSRGKSLANRTLNGLQPVWYTSNENHNYEYISAMTGNYMLHFNIDFNDDLTPFVNHIKAYYYTIHGRKTEAFTLDRKQSDKQNTITITSYLGDVYKVVFSADKGISVYKYTNFKNDNIPFQMVYNHEEILQYLSRLNVRLPGIIDYVRMELPSLEKTIEAAMNSGDENLVRSSEGHNGRVIKPIEGTIKE